MSSLTDIYVEEFSENSDRNTGLDERASISSGSLVVEEDNRVLTSHQKGAHVDSRHFFLKKKRLI